MNENGINGEWPDAVFYLPAGPLNFHFGGELSGRRPVKAPRTRHVP